MEPIYAVDVHIFHMFVKPVRTDEIPVMGPAITYPCAYAAVPVSRVGRNGVV